MNNDFLDYLQRTIMFRKWCEEVRVLRAAEGLDNFGPHLGLQDVLSEEILIYEEYPHLLGEQMNIIERDLDIYVKAKHRAEERVVDGDAFRREILAAFDDGIIMASSLGGEPQGFLEAEILTETNVGFGLVLGFLARLEAKKGVHYKSSWQRRGDVQGVLANISRKHDRLENVYQNGESGAGETATETLGDLAVYSIKALIRRAETNPDEVVAWLQEVKNL